MTADSRGATGPSLCPREGRKFAYAVSNVKGEVSPGVLYSTGFVTGGGGMVYTTKGELAKPTSTPTRGGSFLPATTR